MGNKTAMAICLTVTWTKFDQETFTIRTFGYFLCPCGTVWHARCLILSPVFLESQGSSTGNQHIIRHMSVINSFNEDIDMVFEG